MVEGSDQQQGAAFVEGVRESASGEGVRYGSAPGRPRITSQPSRSLFTICLKGFYLRSTAIWNFDLQRGNFYIPAWLGAGKMWKLEGGTTLNLLQNRR
jgi:hypothetical protein